MYRDINGLFFIKVMGVNMKQLIMGLVAAVLLLSATISTAASLSATYSAVAQPDSSVVLNVTVTNTGVDTVYSAALKPSGMLSDAVAAPINLGDLATGATASFQVSAPNDPGYLVFTGSGQDAIGNPVEFSVVGANQ